MDHKFNPDAHYLYSTQILTWYYVWNSKTTTKWQFTTKGYTINSNARPKTPSPGIQKHVTFSLWKTCPLRTLLYNIPQKYITKRESTHVKSATAINTNISMWELFHTLTTYIQWNQETPSLLKAFSQKRKSAYNALTCIHTLYGNISVGHHQM